MPAWVLLAYGYYCGRHSQRPRLGELWKCLRNAEEAKGQARRQTAAAVLGSKAHRWLAWCLAAILWLICLVLGPDHRIVVAVILAFVPASILAYWVGHRRAGRG
jgi:Flp pilus assembly protein TadB